MATNPVKLTFSQDFHGTMETFQTSVFIGQSEHGLYPYDMLFGALASCFYATFVDIMSKRRLAYSKAEIHISGIKRETIPATLKHTTVALTVYGTSDYSAVEKSALLAAKYCSVYQTISQVSEMELIIKIA